MKALREKYKQDGDHWSPEYSPPIMRNWAKLDLSTTISFLGQMSGPVGALVVGPDNTPVSSLRWGRRLGKNVFSTVHQAIALDESGRSAGAVAVKSISHSVFAGEAKLGDFAEGRLWEQEAVADVVEECGFTARAAGDLRDGVVPCLAVLVPAPSVRAFVSAPLWDTGVPVFAVAGLDRPAAVMPVVEGVEAFDLFVSDFDDPRSVHVPDWAADNFRRSLRNGTAAMWMGGLASCLARAGKFLQDNKLVHRDAKLENVMLRAEFLQDPLDVTNCALIDFGLASYWGDSRFSSKAVGSSTTWNPAMGYFMFLQTHYERRAALDLYSFGSTLLAAALHHFNLYSVCGFDPNDVYKCLAQWPPSSTEEKVKEARQLRSGWSLDDLLIAALNPAATLLCDVISEKLWHLEYTLKRRRKSVDELEQLGHRWEVLERSGRPVLEVALRMLDMTSPNISLGTGGASTLYSLLREAAFAADEPAQTPAQTGSLGKPRL